jgi:hypothetical protein
MSVVPPDLLEADRLNPLIKRFKRETGIQRTMTFNGVRHARSLQMLLPRSTLTPRSQILALSTCRRSEESWLRRTAVSEIRGPSSSVSTREPDVQAAFRPRLATASQTSNRATLLAMRPRG